MVSDVKIKIGLDFSETAICLFEDNQDKGIGDTFCHMSLRISLDDFMVITSGISYFYQWQETLKGS